LFIAACGLKGLSWYYEYTNRDEWRSIVYKSPDYILQIRISELIQNKDSLNENDKNKIISILDDFNKTYHDGIYYVKIQKGNNSFLNYEREVSKDAAINKSSGSYGGIGKGWTIYYKETDFAQAMNEHAWNEVLSRKESSNNPINIFNKYSLMVFIAFWTIMAVYFLQKNLLRKLPSRLYMIILMAETCLVFTALTFEDHKDFMMLFVTGFTIGNIIYERIYKRRVKSS